MTDPQIIAELLKDHIAHLHGENDKILHRLKMFRAQLYRMVSEVSDEIGGLTEAQKKIEGLECFQHEQDSHTEQGIA